MYLKNKEKCDVCKYYNGRKKGNICKYSKLSEIGDICKYYKNKKKNPCFKYLKNKKTGDVCRFSIYQGEDWVKEKGNKEIFDTHELKRKKIYSRKRYLMKTSNDWFDNIENMPKEIKDKRILARKEIEEIKAITNKADLSNYEGF